MDKKSPSTDFDGTNLASLFGKIYQQAEWGSHVEPSEKFFSGSGSHSPSVITPYINVLTSFLSYYRVFCGKRPDILDIGCGDFNVGAKIRPACGNYVGCDVVEPLILRNRQVFPETDFRVLDATRDELPPADIVIVRQVLQHLSNANIAKILAQIVAPYKFLIVTEHLPLAGGFTPNLDVRDNAGIRIGHGSGVVVTEAPFHFHAVEAYQVCAVPEGRGVIQTMLYKLY